MHGVKHGAHGFGLEHAQTGTGRPERSTTSERAHDLSLLSMSSHTWHTMWLNNRMLTCIEHVELPVLLLTEGSGATFETECGGVAALAA